MTSSLEGSPRVSPCRHTRRLMRKLRPNHAKRSSPIIRRNDLELHDVKNRCLETIFDRVSSKPQGSSGLEGHSTLHSHLGYDNRRHRRCTEVGNFQRRAGNPVAQRLEETVYDVGAKGGGTWVDSLYGFFRQLREWLAQQAEKWKYQKYYNSKNKLFYSNE